MAFTTSCKRLAELLSFPAIVTIVTILVGVVLSEVQTKVGWSPLVAALLCFLVIYVVTLVVIGVQYRPMCIGLIEQERNSVIGMVDPTRVGIIDNEGLRTLEGSRHDKKVWLITGDLAEDVPGAQFFDVVHENLQRGVFPLYFMVTQQQTGNSCSCSFRMISFS